MSIVGVLGIVFGGVVDEMMLVSEVDMIGYYKCSKYLVECCVQEYVECGFLVVIVNLLMLVGDFDVKLMLIGQIIVDYLCGKMLVYVVIGFNLIDVWDVV